MDIENLIIGALLILSLLWWCMYRVYFVVRIVMNITVQAITFLVWGSVWLSFPKSFYILKLICAPYFILKKQHFINWLTQIDVCVFYFTVSLLHSDRDAIPEVPAIYFVLPTEENVKRICQVGLYKLSIFSKFKILTKGILLANSYTPDSINIDLNKNFVTNLKRTDLLFLELFWKINSQNH